MQIWLFFLNNQKNDTVENFLFLICFKVNDETTQRELGKFFNKLPLHAEVQNEMFFRLKMACKLEVDDNE